MIPALLLLLALPDASAKPPATATATAAATVVPFRTEGAPRIDPVFGDVATLRAAVDRFLSLQAEMDGVRDEFSSAVHGTLATLAAAAPARGPGAAARQCPPAAAAPYARALASGGRYLALGQQLQATYREIRRSDDFGETLGLTPDYRWKVKKAKDLHQQLLRDYREMRVAFYDQLGAEMRYAGCKPGARAAAAPAPAANPSDPDAWQLDDPAVDPAGASSSSAAPAVPEPTPSSSAAESAGNTATAIWIDIDNTLCAAPTRLAIDGQPLGDAGGHRKISVRTRAGPHEICALPTSDARACGDPGTIRKAYLHEGWTLTIHCGK
jgi:hypothetical protein